MLASSNLQKKKLSHLFMILKVVKLQTTIVGNY